MSFSFSYQFNSECQDSTLLIERNEKWMPTILENIENKQAFITVGLLHLYGQCGLIMQLRNKGYLVSEIELKSK